MSVHSFENDFLADHDAVELAHLVRQKEVSPLELVEAAILRAQRVNDQINAIEIPLFDLARNQAQKPLAGLLAGVPSFIKDNTNLAGQPTRHGSQAVPTKPSEKTGTFAQQFLSLGFILMGKSRLPEFGFNCTTEFDGLAPTANPWNPAYSCGGSSGGAAALVAAGVVPIAHANDGGGSIRIPAACCGLVGLKVSFGRFVTHEMARSLPLNIICDGVVTRSVRDTAHFLAGAEQYRPSRKLPLVGLVEGPGRKRLRIGVVTESLTGVPCPQTLAAVQRACTLLESLGHRVEAMLDKPVSSKFVDDFLDYWGFLAYMTEILGKRKFGRQFAPDKLDGFTRGLAKRFRSHAWRLPTALFRLRSTRWQFGKSTSKFDAILTPVLGHVTPRLGYVSPDVPFDLLLERVLTYAAFTPINNANGTPAIALPLGMSTEGLPIGVQLSAGIGEERVLLELAYELEQASPWPKIQEYSHAFQAMQPIKKELA